MLVILALFVVFGSLLYYYLTHNYDYWKNRGITGPEPKLFVGTLPSTYNKKVHLFYEIDEIYRKYKGKQSVVGIYRGIVPELLILDPELIKSCMTTNYKYFGKPGSNFESLTKETDPLFGRNPFNLEGEEWKEKRGEILPAFSSQRIKALFPIMEAVVDKMKQYIKAEMKVLENIETREMCSKYTTDIVCNSIFGVDSGAFSEQKSELRDIARNIFKPPWYTFIVFGLAPNFPFILKLLPLRLVPEKYTNFITDLLEKSIAYRKETKLERQDFVDFLIQLQQKKGISNLDIAGHTMTFFFDGIESSSITLSFVFYELAKNKQVQDKLRQLLNEIKQKDGNFEYDNLVDHEYLDQVLMETMRLHPALPQLRRKCTETYDMKLPEGQIVRIEKGIVIGFPTMKIFTDPEYYGSDAEQFVPERFNAEHGGVKHFRDKGVFYPFGDGPRICLGQRFAHAQVKCAIAQIVTNFDISVSDKMPENPEYNPMDLLLAFKGGILLKFKEI
ncbi:probable cytochrome P450 28a5 [Culicoides brevitarsis]|uniref:probable cytochrome P450 28a5 n=1 Tax=Culicoides brevitarsis TaxID=469753 RepID=UPI00307BAE6C